MRKKILEFMFIIIMVGLVGCGNVINEMETKAEAEEVLTSPIEYENQSENDEVEEETTIETLDFKETESRYGRDIL